MKIKQDEKNKYLIDMSPIRHPQKGVAQTSVDFKYINNSKIVKYIELTTGNRFTYVKIKSINNEDTYDKVSKDNKIKKLVNDLLSGRRFWCSKESVENINNMRKQQDNVNYESLTNAQRKMFEVGNIKTLDIWYLDNSYVEHLNMSISYRTDDAESMEFLNILKDSISGHVKRVESNLIANGELKSDEISINRNLIHHFKHIENLKTPSKPIFRAYNNKIAYLHNDFSEDEVKEKINVGDTILGIILRSMDTIEYIACFIGGMTIDAFIKTIPKMTMTGFNNIALDTTPTSYNDRLLLNTLYNGSVSNHELELDNLKGIYDSLNKSDKLEKRYIKLLNTLDLLYKEFSSNDKQKTDKIPKRKGLSFVKKNSNENEKEINAILLAIKNESNEYVKNILLDKLGELGYDFRKQREKEVLSLIKEIKKSIDENDILICVYDKEIMTIVSNLDNTIRLEQFNYTGVKLPSITLPRKKVVNIDYSKISSIMSIKQHIDFN